MLTGSGGYLWGLILLIMINVNELRKGNLVKSLTLEIYCPVQTIEVSSIALKCDTGRVRCDYVDHKFTSIDPIPLTPEWLERCGLKDPAGNGLGYRMNINSVDEICWYMQDGFMRYQTQGSGFTRQLQHIKHLHELQNWYYWFTGEELQIKMP